MSLRPPRDGAGELVPPQADEGVGQPQARQGPPPFGLQGPISESQSASLRHLLDVAQEFYLPRSVVAEIADGIVDAGERDIHPLKALAQRILRGEAV